VTDLLAGPYAELVTDLRAFASGLPAYEAAVELLVAHDRHLHDLHFVDECVVTVEVGAKPPVTWIDWDAVAALSATADQLPDAIALLAAELAGVDTGHPLGELIDRATAMDRVAVRIGLNRASAVRAEPIR
jgi:hypothetical protein